MKPRSLFASVMLVSLMFTVSPVFAHSSVVNSVLEELGTRIKNLENACGEDIKKYCGTVTPGNGRVVYCMQAHEDKISTKCGYNLDEVLIDFEDIKAGLTKAI